MENILNNMKIGKIESELIRMSINGEIAVKVNNDYKYYDSKKKSLINTDQFIFDIGDEFFFMIPTNKINVGDIILVNNTPAYVLGIENDNIEILSYENGSINKILPEKHVILGETYMYSKVVSMLDNKNMDSKQIMNYMLLNSLFGNNKSNEKFANVTSSKINPLMLMMLMGNKDNFLSSIFNFNNDSNKDSNK